ncbi:Protein of unknown function [Altererythrobacter xiamenensis]|uniref:DUF3489 domain-containing protein n=1 Tax=Altererythrobacter xiamenensis TaxID=1316679 RepID=A0A1Y6FA38_9SPHN|nr:DUF3489 domain-containing protein [Altererythrobacter xiamenensis]SMQ69632.1 Protein of unknown function [Altererythrobacter xiamenensis]
MTKQKTTARKTKSANVNRLLRRSKGATLAEIENATSWKPHSCRAFLSGVRKQGIALAKEERANGETAYKVSGEAESCRA